MHRLGRRPTNRIAALDAISTALQLALRCRTFTGRLPRDSRCGAGAARPTGDRVRLLTDFLAVILREVNLLLRELAKLQLRLRAAPVVNAMIGRAADRSPVVEWGIQQDMT